MDASDPDGSRAWPTRGPCRRGSGDCAWEWRRSGMHPQGSLPGPPSLHCLPRPNRPRRSRTRSSRVRLHRRLPILRPLPRGPPALWGAPPATPPLVRDPGGHRGVQERRSRPVEPRPGYLPAPRRSAEEARSGPERLCRHRRDCSSRLPRTHNPGTGTSAHVLRKPFCVLHSTVRISFLHAASGGWRRVLQKECKCVIFLRVRRLQQGV